MRIHWFAAIACSAILHAGTAGAQPAWRPERAVELVVPTASGGANDQVARAVQRILRDEKLLLTPLEVMNKAGGNQTIAATYVNQHPGDPHYLLVANPTLMGSHIAGITPLNYTDLTAVALLLSEHTLFSVPVDSPIRTARDLFDRLKADPESVIIGVVSRGGPSHLALSAAVRAAGIDARKLKTVVFKTNTESLTAMAGGHIHAVAASVSSSLGHFRSGRSRLVALVAAQRMPGVLAEVPTLREQGVDVTQASWRVIFAPKGISPVQVSFWDDALARMAATDEWKKTLETNGWAGPFLRGRELGKYLDDNYRVTRAVMVDLGMAK
jgi:putative tricarboxylic transport membrane protein